jgi:hypothetical protein
MPYGQGPLPFVAAKSTAVATTRASWIARIFTVAHLLSGRGPTGSGGSLRPSPPLLVLDRVIFCPQSEVVR